MHYTRLIYTLVTALLLSGCVTEKKAYYAYTVNTYSVTNDEQKQINSERLISYGDYLFEFKMRVNFIREVLMLSQREIRNITYDTIGVYLLSELKDRYAEFDTFSTNARLVKSGANSEKEYGTKFPIPTNGGTAGFWTQTMHDTIINGHKNYLSDTLITDSSGAVIGGLRLFLVKEKKFNSVYKINHSYFPDKEYCIVGYNYSFPREKQGVLSIMEEMRPLSKEEEAVCATLVKKYLSVNK